ncbi:MAG: aromatic-ring-hydroxylating dioxygenase subunit beta [Rhodospirillaceae bacterium]|nr:aromatic-ring-hydroxylating dioxygenase subunit beta [Rhodospirillaceae bacterium]MCY4239341.1 aromatic-ring-hydroxylating dioxygenase subunit beta [Rhodospirillaceae bacterium]MCY4311223.1 aromatic-ring-hydroxylating dioxygenase subunit beta [Rhodospirillaceae bacterium]
MIDVPETSLYLTDQYYADTIAAFEDCWEDSREILDVGIRNSCRAFLEHEARILDEQRLDDWLALFVAECAYWIPSTPEAGDPRKEITITFDDRRRLEDRVFRLQTDAAWSQQPASRTSRMISNVATFHGPNGSDIMVRSVFQTTEFRRGDTRRFAGCNRHHLRTEDNGWRIVAKQVNLIDCDQNLRNPSIIL